MKRKLFLGRLSLGIGGTFLIPSASLIQSCSYKPKIRIKLSEDDIPFLDEIGETIIPSTSASLGAKAAKLVDL